MFLFATIDFRANKIFFRSDPVIFFTKDPIAFSIFLILKIIFLSSNALRLDFWSGPSQDLLSVKCFSITSAPKATAAIEISIPKVWSE